MATAPYNYSYIFKYIIIGKYWDTMFMPISVCNSVPPNYCWFLLQVTYGMALALWVVPHPTSVPHRSPCLPKALAADKNECRCFVCCCDCCQVGWEWGWLLILIFDRLTSNAAGGRALSAVCFSFLQVSLFWPCETSVKSVMQLSSFVYFLLHPCLQLCTCNQNYSVAVMLINLEGCSQV